MEALYARGFRSAADITALSQADFRQALTGTIAYESGDKLYARRRTCRRSRPPTASPARNSSRSTPMARWSNCVPPPSLSPTGPIAYLQEMLTVSELSSCDDPARATLTLDLAERATADGKPAVLTFRSVAGVRPGMPAAAGQIPDGTTVSAVSGGDATVTLSGPLSAEAPGTSVTFTAPTLGTVLSQRRGPVGALTASRANLETPLPLVDLVNECLEYLGAAATPAGGTVYDTADDAGHLLAMTPGHSTPAAPDGANAAVEPAVFNKLKADFSSCLLPYSQALDVSRTYLGQLGSSRFEEMRTFRRCITEFVLDPAQEPAGFQSWLWRYPVRVDIAIEYLGITPEEYATLFQGTAAPPCAPRANAAGRARRGRGRRPALEAAAAEVPAQEPGSIIGLPAFLAETCLSYCEFCELWQSDFVGFRNGADRKDGIFPECEPCCPEELWLQFPADQQEHDAAELLVFVRLWRTLRESCAGGYSFAELRDICDVLRLQADGAANPDFIRQLAAFQMLRDDFRLDLTDPDATVTPDAVDADRTHLLALWEGPTATQWPWAVRAAAHAGTRSTRCGGMAANGVPTEFVKLLAENLDPLSRLAGFDPGSATGSWHALPTHTLRFAEVLAKIYASRFTVGELIFLFTADPHLDGDDPFPLQDENEALDSPLGLPDDEPEPRPVAAAPGAAERGGGNAEGTEDEEAEKWPWRRIESALQTEFGFAAADTTALGQHFFPDVLARAGPAGHPVVGVLRHQPRRGRHVGADVEQPAGRAAALRPATPGSCPPASRSPTGPSSPS